MASAWPAMVAVCFAPAAFCRDSARLLRQTDQKLGPAHREGYTLLLAIRSWEFCAFARLRR
jgi:hypothetical protein